MNVLMHAALDAIDLEICWNRLIAIADEAGAALKRTSFSTVVRESNDFACVILDAEGRLIGQSSLSVPGFIGTAPLSMKRMLEFVPKSNLEPGDVLFTNDPWIGTGHLPDSTMAMPVFARGKIVAFVIAIAHLSDIGGRPWSADANEVYEEGIRFPVIKLMVAGQVNQLAMDLLMANVRVPNQVRGDIEAQLVAVELANRRLVELLDEYGFPDLERIAGGIFRASNDAALRELRTIPPGVYTGSVESDGWDEPVRICATVTIAPDRVTIDYRGSSPQSRFGINESFNHTYAYTIYPFKCMLSPSVPNNDGFTRLFEVIAPEGSIVNCRDPAPVNARHLVGQLLQAAIFRALADVLPGNVQADSGTPHWNVLLRGVDENASFATIMFFNGGVGAMRDQDGASTLSFPGNVSNTPIEVAENVAPILFKSKHLAVDSGGAGIRSGGLGQVVSFESLWPGVMRASLLTERTRVPAGGLAGGEPGKTGQVSKNGVTVQQAKGIIDLRKGDVLEFCTPGGGGYGRSERMPSSTSSDISPEKAMIDTPEVASELLVAIGRYFDLMYDCDVSKFDTVFHSSAALNGLRDGGINIWSAAQYRDVLSKRESPKSLNAARHQEVVLIDAASTHQAIAKVRVLINGTMFVDHLTYLKTDGEWKIAFKAYHVESK